MSRYTRKNQFLNNFYIIKMPTKIHGHHRFLEEKTLKMNCTIITVYRVIFIVFS